LEIFKRKEILEGSLGKFLQIDFVQKVKTKNCVWDELVAFVENRVLLKINIRGSF